MFCNVAPTCRAQIVPRARADPVAKRPTNIRKRRPERHRSRRVTPAVARWLANDRYQAGEPVLHFVPLQRSRPFGLPSFRPCGFQRGTGNAEFTFLASAVDTGIIATCHFWD